MLERFGLVTTYTMAVSIIVWNEMRREQRVPHPEKLMYVAIVWAFLGIAADLGIPELAALFGIGYILAMLYRYKFGTPAAGAGKSSVDHSNELQPA